MVGFTTKAGDGRLLIGLGFSDGNLRLLREGKPIWYPFGRLNLPWRGGFVINYGRLPEGTPEPPGIIFFSLTENVLNALAAGKLIKIGFDYEEYNTTGEVVFFYGETEDAIREMFIREGLIGPSTVEKGVYAPDGPHRH